ncbi:hypothetical protein BCR41DRAFT_396467 [Rhizophagus irregularis DAOM 181602=DAOM 197198]|nr:hypothetical protein BCR41DRAFT_396467 [Rhizophagus irregularis DAOM 181602=DAOM 197198]
MYIILKLNTGVDQRVYWCESTLFKLADGKTRRLCNYNYNDLLLQVPEVLISVPVTTIHKFARKSWRYMDAYNKGLEGRTAEWAVSKYKSHRRLPDNIEKIMDDLDNT